MDLLETDNFEPWSLHPLVRCSSLQPLDPRTFRSVVAAPYTTIIVFFNSIYNFEVGTNIFVTYAVRPYTRYRYLRAYKNLIDFNEMQSFMKLYEF